MQVGLKLERVQLFWEDVQVSANHDLIPSGGGRTQINRRLDHTNPSSAMLSEYRHSHGDKNKLEPV